MRQSTSYSRFVRIRWIVVLYAVASGPQACAKEFYHQFRGQSPHPAMKVYGKEADQFVRRELDGIRITLPAEREGRSVVGVSPVFSVAGDFEITFSYEVVEADAGPNGQVGVNLRVMAGDPAGEVADLGRYRGLGNQHGFLIKHTTDFDTEERQEDLKFVPAKTGKGTLRLERKGTTLRYLVAEEQDAGFRQLHQVESIADDCRFRLATIAGGGQTLDVRYVDVRVRADELPNMQPEWIETSRAWVWWLVGPLVVGVGVAGFFLWRRRSGGAAAERSAGSRRVS